MEPSILLLFFGIGGLVGLLAGFFGIGGGAVLNPFLLTFFELHNYNPEIYVQLAFGTSLFVSTFSSLFSVYRHQKNHNVIWRVVPIVAPGSIIGAYLGSCTAAILPGAILKKIFALAVAVLAYQMFRGYNSVSQVKSSKHEIARLISIGLGGGFVAALIGIGGGILYVPLMALALHYSVKKIAGTSSAIIIFTALAGTVGYVLHGWNHPLLPDGSWGFVYVKGVIPLLVGALIFSQIGAQLNHLLPAKIVRVLFASFLVVVFIKMMFF